MTDRPISLVAGTRPNFMKVAPVLRALRRRSLPTRLIHTGQHFDPTMSEVFYQDLGLPAPDVDLQVGPGSHAEHTAKVLIGMEQELERQRAALVVVVGDVTSTLAAALAAAKLGVPVAHVESGLRSRDWNMPEEINRVLTDQLSDLLLIPSRDAEAHLIAEGVSPNRIVFVGNVMIDSLHHALGRSSNVLDRLGIAPGAYAVATLHRPANVDTRETLRRTLDALEVLAARLPVVFPVHPRTWHRARDLGLAARLHGMTGLRTVEPLGYDDFVALLSRACLVATDSGGIQEESTALGIPCLTMREGTERPVTVSEGTNVVVGLDRARIAVEADTVLAGRGKRGRIPEGWDGHAAERVADAIVAFLGGQPPPKTAGARA